MFARPFVLLCALLSTQILLAQRPGNAQGAVPKTCSVTTPHQTSTFVPPAPYEAKPWGHELFLVGTDRLWTQLPITGIWNGGKMFWWRQGYDAHQEPRPKLQVTGKRLNGLAPILKGTDPTNAFAPPRSAMLIGVEFPTIGCWEIIGRLQDAMRRMS